MPWPGNVLPDSLVTRLWLCSCLPSRPPASCLNLVLWASGNLASTHHFFTKPSTYTSHTPFLWLRTKTPADRHTRNNARMRTRSSGLFPDPRILDSNHSKKTTLERGKARCWGQFNHNHGPALLKGSPALPSGNAQSRRETGMKADHPTTPGNGTKPEGSSKQRSGLGSGIREGWPER